ncbi:MAG: hypothetical protein ACI81T_002369, partial [Bacteroidia bacterium]
MNRCGPTIGRVRRSCLAKFALNADYQVDGFDFPIGKPDADDYYNAQ